MYALADTAQFELQIPSVDHRFKVLGFEGTEAISCLYAINIQLVSEDRDFPLETLLGQPAFLRFGLNGEGLHGFIENASIAASDKRLTHYGLTLVPALHYLQFSYNQRIFQNLSVPQIIAQVLESHGILSNSYSFNVRESSVREYCTQYDESDFLFIQRLSAEDGIAWHHQHSPDGHLLALTDNQVYFPSLGDTPYRQDSAMVADHPVINLFTQYFNTRTSTVTGRKYNFMKPSLLYENQARVDNVRRLEDYRYPMLMKEPDQHGKVLARQALERHRCDYDLVKGRSDQPTLRSGHLFNLTEHPRKKCNDRWLLLSVSHTGKQPQCLEETITEPLPGDEFTQGYRNTFSAIPKDVFYRPPLLPQKRILVSQSARVTGPPGEEIYVDEHGRVKVELHWDRAGFKSEKSSCWLRVATGWAGEGFGAVTIPRVGMEVVVTYYEGNPDLPMISGCVINTRTPAPYPLPAHKTKTVLRSQSSPRTGGFNELMIEDRAGQEKVYLRAERDLEQLIRNDSNTTINNDRNEQIARNSSSLIKGDESHTTQGQRDSVIGGSEVVSITDKSSTTVGNAWVVKAGSHAHLTATHVVINAGMSLTINVGGQHIVINPAGIYSSVPLEVGGKPLLGLAPLQALEAQALAEQPVIAPTQAALMAATKAKSADFCPICEVCKNGFCLPQGATA
ncbi:type VI secretion system tip protein TssI/VgrG [Pseudomonas sp. PD9R]|uniref:type VI secretion system tip protein TssI/VgrG n=1 Tax=Pseudomonas sp. PD9R TaxID=2853534 RepID=UPI001C43AC43|nr:type VI secretion system tip protein TssI/VgrG [Pseudomonas sp. PD9R]MBV6826030.1 type VI secretion system tip protein VgrG [Pseudomonas sp. PD9R]